MSERGNEQQSRSNLASVSREIGDISPAVNANNYRDWRCRCGCKRGESERTQDERESARRLGGLQLRIITSPLHVLLQFPISRFPVRLATCRCSGSRQPSTTQAHTLVGFSNSVKTPPALASLRSHCPLFLQETPPASPPTSNLARWVPLKLAWSSLPLLKQVYAQSV